MYCKKPVSQFSSLGQLLRHGRLARRGAGHVHDDMQFARWLIDEIGVACIPASPFYQESDKHLGKFFARFAVCKKDETLDAAAERFAKLGKM